MVTRRVAPWSRPAPQRTRQTAPQRARRGLPVLLLAILSGACATGGSANRINLPINDARGHAVGALQQHGYVVVNDGGRPGGEAPDRLTVVGERQLQTGWQGDRHATIVMRVSLRRHGAGPEAGTEVAVSHTVRHQSAGRGGGSDYERQQMAAIARRDADALHKAILSATTIGWE